jgi:hypothetical protein
MNGAAYIEHLQKVRSAPTGARWSGPRFFGLRRRPLVLDSHSRAGEGDGEGEG